MSGLKEMSVNEILDNIGVSLEGRHIELVLNNNEEALEKISMLFSEWPNEDGITMQVLRYKFRESVIREVFEEFESSINKYLLVMLTLYNNQSALENGSCINFDSKQRNLFKRDISNAIRLMGKKDIRLIDFEYHSESNLIKRVKVISSQELINAIKNKIRLSSLERLTKKELERIEKIDREVEFDNITQTLVSSDISNIASVDEDIGIHIVRQILNNALIRFSETHPEIDKEVLNGNKPLDRALEKELRLSSEYRMAALEGIKANLKYIDLDRLLLISAFRYIDILESDEKGELKVGVLEDNGKVTIKEDLESFKEIIESMRKNITKGTTIEGVVGINGETTKYSLEDLEKDLNRFVNGRYIRKADIQKAKEDILSGEKMLHEIDEKLLKIIEFNDEELVSIIKLSEDNVIFLIEHNKIKEEEIYKVLHIRNECSLRLFKIVLDRGMLDGEQILKLYEYGIIGLEHISTIEDEKLLNSINIEERINQICTSIQNSEENENVERIEHLNKLASLFKALRIKGKTEEEINEISNSLIESFEENLSNDILERLYQFGIVSLDIVADWGIDLIEVMSRGDMKPNDLKRLYDNKTIQMDEIRNVLINSDISYEEKLDLIYSTFDGESEEEYNIREELVQLLENGESYRAEVRQTGNKRGTGKGTRSKEYITDPHARWKLISLLDKEYSRKFLPKEKQVIDGHRIFLLPNLDFIVIERMHEYKGGRKSDAYAYATYIMEPQEFFENIDKIIEDGAINRTALREFSRVEKATRITHSTAWGASVKRYFGVNVENERYSEEDRQKIDEAIENVKNSRRERQTR